MCFVSRVIKSLFFVFSLAYFGFVSAETEDAKGNATAQTKTYRIPGAMCFASRHPFKPDMVTYVTTLPEFMTEGHITDCLAHMKKEKWNVVRLSATSEMVETLREARTQNMACAHIGLYQMPMLHQVVFADFALTGKGPELVECMSLSADAPNKVPTQPSAARATSL